MVTAIILSIGSRGDTEPLIALATELLSNFTQIHFFHLPDYTNLIPKNPAIISHPLPFSANDFTPIFTKELLKAFFFAIFTGFDMVKVQTAALGQLIKQHVVPLLPTLIDLSEQIHPDVIISTGLGFTVAMSLAEKCGVPAVFFNFQPNTPTTAYPCYLHSTDSALLAADQIAELQEKPSDLSADAEQYLQTYQTRDTMLKPSHPTLNTFRTSHGLNKIHFTELEQAICGKKSHVHIINSCKPLVPPSSEHTENVHIVPPLAASYLPQEWDPQESCPGVVEYLSKGEKPICVTFGSMGGIVSSANITRQLLHGLRAAGAKRVLLLNSTTSIGTENLWHFRDADLIEWAKKHIFVTKETPQFAWLFPQCKAILCHGGAGTTFAGLRAGIPVIVSPVLCDQFFWGRLVENMGLGAVAGPRLERATKDSFDQAVRRALTEEVIERAREFGEVEQGGDDGARIAASIISSLVSTK